MSSFIFIHHFSIEHKNNLPASRSMAAITFCDSLAASIWDVIEETRARDHSKIPFLNQVITATYQRNLVLVFWKDDVPTLRQILQSWTPEFSATEFHTDVQSVHQNSSNMRTAVFMENSRLLFIALCNATLLTFQNYCFPFNSNVLSPAVGHGCHYRTSIQLTTNSIDIDIRTDTGKDFYAIDQRLKRLHWTIAHSDNKITQTF